MATTTLNHAIETLQLEPGETLNLETGNIVTAQLASAYSNPDTINLGTGNIVTFASPANGGGALNINVTGSGDILKGEAKTNLAAINLNIAAGKSLLSTASIDETNGSITGGGTLVNDGSIDVNFAASINVNVLGLGTIEFGGWHDTQGRYNVNGASGPGQTYLLNAANGNNMSINHPDTFQSTVGFLGDFWQTVTLAGVSATSYDLKNDLLTLYQGNSPVYHLHLKDVPQNFYVASGGGSTVLGTPAPWIGAPSDTLPLHTGV